MQINQNAFDAAWEAMGWDNQNPQATDAQERFVAAYDAAKSPTTHQPVGSSLAEGLNSIALFISNRDFFTRPNTPERRFVTEIRMMVETLFERATCGKPVHRNP